MEGGTRPETWAMMVRQAITREHEHVALSDGRANAQGNLWRCGGAHKREKKACTRIRLLPQEMNE